MARVSGYLDRFRDLLINSSGRSSLPNLRDDATGLHHRGFLKSQLDYVLSTKDCSQLVVFAASINRFDELRSMIGYDAVSEIVRELGEKITGIDVIEEIALIAPDTMAGFFFSDSVKANKVVTEVLQKFEDGTHLQDGVVSITATLGFTLFSSGSGAETLLRQAELGLGQARNNYRRSWLFSASEYGSPEKKLGLMANLRRGLDEDEFDLHYQPQLNGRTGAINGVEGLLRWTRSANCKFTIAEIIELAERTGDIRLISIWVMRRAIRDLEELSRQNLDLRIAINLSGRLVCDDEFIDEIIELGGDHLGSLQMEVTETAMLLNPERALRNLKKLSDVGIELAMDDYGTGYSSLSQIQDLPINELKIDRRFIQNLTATHRDPLIVRSTIDLAHALEMQVVAEGVEDAATYALLRAMGCDVMQGYFIAKAMPLPDLIAFIADQDAIEAKHNGPLLDFSK